ncbi:hypothetical protein FACS189444_5540 [Spirochaetia bacterium]|nr:hypothetical protein FACS189444_5540 [Spirochaetia bacterium]
MTDAKIKDIPAYMYVNGLAGAASIHLTATYDGATHILVDETSTGRTISDGQFPLLADGVAGDALPPPSVAIFSLTDAVNAEGDVKLEYKVTLNRIVHVINDDNPLSKVTVDIAIILPLKLAIPNTPEAADIVPGYLKFNLKPLDDAMQESDLGGDNPLEGLTLKEVKITMEDIKNSMTDDLILGLKVTKAGGYNIIPLKAGGTEELKFLADDLDGALGFKFVALVKKPTSGSDPGTLTPGTLTFKPIINKKPAEFGFELVVDAQADLDMKLF